MQLNVILTFKIRAYSVSRYQSSGLEGLKSRSRLGTWSIGEWAWLGRIFYFSYGIISASVYAESNSKCSEIPILLLLLSKPANAGEGCGWNSNPKLQNVQKFIRMSIV